MFRTHVASLDMNRLGVKDRIQSFATLQWTNKAFAMDACLVFIQLLTVLSLTGMFHVSFAYTYSSC